MKRVIVAAVLAVALTHTNFAYGQGTLVNAKLEGRVLDQSGAVIPGASLELHRTTRREMGNEPRLAAGELCLAQEIHNHDLLLRLPHPGAEHSQATQLLQNHRRWLSGDPFTLKRFGTILGPRVDL